MLDLHGLTDGEAPGSQAWARFAHDLNSQYGRVNDKLFLLQRSLDVRTREVQALYRDLLLMREQLHSTLAALDGGFALFDEHGTLLLINPGGEDLLEWDELTPGPRPSLDSLGVRALFPHARLEALLAHAPAVTGHGRLTRPNGTTLELDVTVEAVSQRGQSVGFALLFRDESAPSIEQRLSSLESTARELLGESLTAHQRAAVEQILGQARRAQDPYAPAAPPPPPEQERAVP